MKDDDGREGWDVIRAATEKTAAAPEGGNVVVDMNGASVVPGSIFATIRNKDVTITFDMGNSIIWTVHGKDITLETIRDTDLSVKAGAGEIPQGIINDMAGSMAHLELSLAHDGEFGFSTMFSIRINSNGNDLVIGSGTTGRYTGMYANLFYYNPILRKLEFICADRVKEDGTAGFLLKHASDYTVILSEYPMDGTDELEKPSGTQDETKPDQPQETEAVPHAQVKSVKLSRKVFPYSGKAKKPSVVAVDTSGKRISEKYYSVTYKDNKKVGKATATVTFKNGYSGTVKKVFTIRPAGTSIKKATAVSGGFTVQWAKKIAQTSGYQVQYSTNAGFIGNSTHSVFVKKASVTKCTVKKQKAGKTYFVRIRTYKTVKTAGKSKRIYSAWCKPVSR